MGACRARARSSHSSKSSTPSPLASSGLRISFHGKSHFGCLVLGDTFLSAMASRRRSDALTIASAAPRFFDYLIGDLSATALSHLLCAAGGKNSDEVRWATEKL